MRVGEAHVDGAWPVGAWEGKSGLNSQAVKEGEAPVCSSVKVGGGLALSLGREESGGVGCCILVVELTCN